MVEIDASLQAMVWRVVHRHAELAGIPAPDPANAYAVFDGLFWQALLAHAEDPDGSCTRLAERAETVLGQLHG